MAEVVPLIRDVVIVGVGLFGLGTATAPAAQEAT